LAYFKTHYYGGIKNTSGRRGPLALYGVIVKENGEKVDISIGDSEADPYSL